MTRRCLWMPGIFTMLSFLLSSAVANAADIKIYDNNPDGSITITWADFEGGFTVNKAAKESAGSATFTPSAGLSQLSFTGTWIAPSGSPGNTVLYFIDPGTSHVRDILTMQWARSETGGAFATLVGTFQSSALTDLGTAPAGAKQIPLTGGLQDLLRTGYFPVFSNLTFSVVGKVATGSSLGTTGTSSNAAGGTQTPINGTTLQGVNTATGNTYVRVSDLIVPGKGLRFNFVRFYNSQDPYSGPLCRGWTHSYNILLTPDAASGVVTIKEGDGHENVFQPGVTPGSYVAPTGVYDVLSAQGGFSYTLSRPDKTVLTFGPVSTSPLLVRLLSIRDRVGNTQVLSYDSTGNLISFRDVGGGTFNFAYDANNHLTSLSDVALGRTFSYSCDTTNLTKYTDALGKVSIYSYVNGALVTEVDPRSNVAISNTFDSQGRITSRNRGGGCGPTTYSYDDVNHVTTITDPLGAITRHHYDTSQRLIGIDSAVGTPIGYTTTLEYNDPNNSKNVTGFTNGLGRKTTYTYDANGNLTVVKDALGNTIQFEYDPATNLLMSQTDANGKRTAFGYQQGRLTSVTDALLQVTQYTYDTRGNRIGVKNAKGNSSQSEFDAANRITSITDPGLAGLKTLYTYDAGGRLQTQTEPAGNIKTMNYDGLGRLVKVTYSPGTKGLMAVGPATYEYDENGNRTKATQIDAENFAIVSTYGRDALNRITGISFVNSRTPANAQTVSYTYDCNDNRTSIQFSDKTITYSYDLLNRLSAVRSASPPAAPTLIASYSYDNGNNLLGVKYQNGSAVTFAYDQADRLINVTNSYVGNSGNPVSSFSYVLDKVGNRTQVTDGAGNVTTYTYDPLYRLTATNVSGKITTYTYDAVGNRMKQQAPGSITQYLYDPADRLQVAAQTTTGQSTLGQTTFKFDDNGNLNIQATKSAKLTYTFDAANRLVAIAGGAAGVSQFGYDADGNRISQTVGTATYNYLNDTATDFATVLEENGPDGRIQYFRGRALISANGASFTNYYHYDGQGSVVGLTDPSGQLAQQYVYNAWGELQQSAPEPKIGAGNKFGYTGEALDPGSSLYYLRARYYDPGVGRFISKDRFWGYEQNPQTLNRFAYVRNNPATLTDRTGLWCDECVDEDPLSWPGGFLFP